VITSGSNGSKKFSELVQLLVKLDAFRKFDVTFVTGFKYYDEVIKNIKESNQFKIVPFIDNLSNYLKDTSVVITRSGSLTLSEIKYLGIFPIIIPSPNVTKNHQLKNALLFDFPKKIFEEHDLDTNKFASYLKNFQIHKISGQISNSTNAFVKEIENVTKLY
jgi:UDP-N-acetylglucosamine:LPS N-acetylglucosamine transferase